MRFPLAVCESCDCQGKHIIYTTMLIRVTRVTTMHSPACHPLPPTATNCNRFDKSFIDQLFDFHDPLFTKLRTALEYVNASKSLNPRLQVCRGGGAGRASRVGPASHSCPGCRSVGQGGGAVGRASRVGPASQSSPGCRSVGQGGEGALGGPLGPGRVREGQAGHCRLPARAGTHATHMQYGCGTGAVRVRYGCSKGAVRIHSAALC